MAKRDDLAGGRTTNSPSTPQRNTNTPTDTNTQTNFNSQGAGLTTGGVTTSSALGGSTSGVGTAGGPGVVPTDSKTRPGESFNQSGQGGHQASGLKEEAKSLAQEAKEQTKEVASQAKDQVNQLVSKQKDQAAERLGGFAGALRDAAGKLEGQEGIGLGRYAGQAAEQVDRFSNYLRQGDLKGFVRDAENLARRNPDLFLGGALLAGVMLARFLKASDPRREALVRYEDGPQGAAHAGFAGSTGGAYGSPSYTTERYPGSGDVSGGRPYDPSPAGV